MVPVNSGATNFSHTYPISFHTNICPVVTRVYDSGTSGVNPTIVRTYDNTRFTVNNANSTNGVGFAYIAIGT